METEKHHDVITFTPDLIRNLRRRFDHAVSRGEGKFRFQGHVLITSYARYLLEYLEGMEVQWRNTERS